MMDHDYALPFSERHYSDAKEYCSTPAPARASAGAASYDQSGKPTSPSGVEIIVGKTTIFDDGGGFFYRCVKTSNGKKFLQCVEYSSKHKCKGTAVCLNEEEDGRQTIIGKKAHCHGPNLRQYRRKANFLNSVRHRATTERTKIGKIFKEELARHPEADGLINRDSLRRSLLRARSQKEPPVPNSLKNMGEIIGSDTYRQRLASVLEGEEPFYRGEIKDASNQFVGIWFYDPKVRAALRSLDVCSYAIDGTFQVVPRIRDATQLATIFAIAEDIAFPVAFGLLKSQTTESYTAFLQQLKEDLGISPPRIITDFERALRIAASTVFPDATLQPCWFHFSQATLRKAKEIKMHAILRDNGEALRILKMIMALPLLPAREVEEYPGLTIQTAWEVLKTHIANCGLSQEFGKFVTYFQNYWINVVGPDDFSVFGATHRTNNYLESFHSTLMRAMGSHSGTWDFYYELRAIVMEKRNSIEYYSANGQRAMPRKPCRASNNETIRRGLQKYSENFSTLGLLRHLAHCSDFYTEREIGGT